MSRDDEYNLSLEASKRFLYRHVGKMIDLVTLIIYYEGWSSVSPNVLTYVTKLLTREISEIINNHNGYVFRYVGGSIIAFFPTEFDARKASINALASTRDILNTVERINKELLDRGYARIDVRIVVDYSSNLVILYGNDRSAEIDLIGQGIGNTSLLKYNHNIIITESLYERLEGFKELLTRIDGAYTLSSNLSIRNVIDGKALVYKIIDELGLEELVSRDASAALRELFKNIEFDILDDDTARKVLLASMHFILSKTMIQSERSIKIDADTIDIVIPSSKVLKSDPKNAILLLFPDATYTIDRFEELQPYKENIWIVSSGKMYNGYRVYVPDQFSDERLRPLSSIIDDLRGFKKGLSIFPL